MNVGKIGVTNAVVPQSVGFKGEEPAVSEKPEKKSHLGRNLLITGLVAAAGVGIYLATKRKSKGAADKVEQGTKKLTDAAKKALSDAENAASKKVSDARVANKIDNVNSEIAELESRVSDEAHYYGQKYYEDLLETDAIVKAGKTTQNQMANLTKEASDKRVSNHIDNIIKAVEKKPMPETKKADFEFALAEQKREKEMKSKIYSAQANFIQKQAEGLEGRISTTGHANRQADLEAAVLAETAKEKAARLV